MELILIIEKVRQQHPEVTSLRDLTKWAWRNLNPREFSIGKVWLGGWKMGGHGTAHDWYEYDDCIVSNELVDFFCMVGASQAESNELVAHMISQSFIKVVFNLKVKDVKGRPGDYLLQINC